MVALKSHVDGDSCQVHSVATLSSALQLLPTFESDAVLADTDDVVKLMLNHSVHLGRTAILLEYTHQLYRQELSKMSLAGRPQP